MGFSLPSEIEDYRARIADFVVQDILPLEGDRANYDAHENIALQVLEALREKARAPD